MTASPCVAICRLDPVTRRCIGCGRTMDEIAAWPDLDDEERRRILDRLRGQPLPAAPPRR